MKQNNIQPNQGQEQPVQEESQGNQKVQIPISQREELYMVKEKVVDEIEYVFNEHIKTEIAQDEAQQVELDKIKNNFKKRLKAFYNNIIITFRDNVEYQVFDDLKKSKRQSLFTARNHKLEENNIQQLNQFREIINKTDGLKEKVIYQFQDKIEQDLKAYKAYVQSNKEKQKNIFKIKDDQGQERDLDLDQFIKICIEQIQNNIQKELDRVKQLQPELKEQQTKYYMNTRQQLKKTIELEYAFENIKKSNNKNMFQLPKIPDDLFD